MLGISGHSRLNLAVRQEERSLLRGYPRCRRHFNEENISLIVHVRMPLLILPFLNGNILG